MTDLSRASGAEAGGAVGFVSAGVHIVDDSNAGGADLAADLAAGNGEGVTGNSIGIGAVGNLVGGDIDVSLVTLTVDQDHAGGTALHISNAAFLGDIFTLSSEGGVELVRSSDFGVGPAGDGSGTQVLGHVGGTGQVQTHGITAGRNQSPGLVDIFNGDISGMTAVSSIIVVGLCPNDQLVSLSGLVKAGGVSAGVLAADDILQDSAAPGVIGDGHILGISVDRQIAAGVVQYFAVAVQLVAVVLLAEIILSAVDDGGPEIAGAVGIVGSFDVLGTVEAEAVSAGIDAFLQEVQNVGLYLLVGGVQIRQTGHAVLRYVKAIVVIGGVLGVIMPAGSIVTDIINDGIGQIVGGGVAHMVGNHVNDDLQALIVSSLTHLLEIGLSAQGAVAGVVDGEGSGLIEHPPVVAGMFCGGLLGGLDGRGLDGSIAQSGDGIQISGDLIEGPVPAMQSYAVLNGFHSGLSFGCLSRDCGKADAGYQYQSQHQAKGA